MFRVCLSQTSRSLNSTCCSQIPSSSVSLHTAAVLHYPRRLGQLAKKRNVQRSQERMAKEVENKPSVVLGTRSHEEGTGWANCDLAKCLVNAHHLNGPPATPSSSTTPSSSSTAPPNTTETINIPDLDVSVSVPKNANYGITEVEKRMLFEELPTLSVSAPFTAAGSHFRSLFDGGSKDMRTPEDLKAQHIKGVQKEERKLDAFAKVIDLRNANAGGIAFENRRRIILEFSAPENPFDPGRSEVQAALLTYQIRNLWNHLTTFKRDVANRRGLLKLIHQRAKILKYLKRKDQDRYESLLPRLALDPKSVEGELVV